jgi:predicted TPR repeat methyltransferase
MTLKQFKIGKHFFTTEGEWVCTDVGTRTIAAVKLKELLASGDKEPPYSIVEHLFDRYDMDGCCKDPNEL